LIIADDGSAEETQRYLRSIAGSRVKIVSLAHSGNPSLVRNAAIRAATGRYVAFLDSDDVWVPGKLAMQVAALQSGRDARWCYSACEHIDAGGGMLPKKNPRPIIRPQGWIFEQLLMLQIGIAMPTVVAERSLIDEAGGFDEQQRFGEFHDFCLRLALKGAVVALDEPLCRIRIHDEHYSSDKAGDQAGWMRLYEKMSHFAMTPAQVGYCAKMRATTSLKLARQLAAGGEFRSAGATLLAARRFSWRFPRWWWGLLKEAVRLAVPASIVSLLRRVD
jgi:glycosyltransferase involved in cell wall biosynthesis